jgi:hypothetical protein
MLLGVMNCELLIGSLLAFVVSNLACGLLIVTVKKVKKAKIPGRKLLCEILTILFILGYALALWVSLKILTVHLGIAKNVVLAAVGIPLLLPPIGYGIWMQTRLSVSKSRK